MESQTRNPPAILIKGVDFGELCEQHRGFRRREPSGYTTLFRRRLMVKIGSRRQRDAVLSTLYQCQRNTSIRRLIMVKLTPTISTVQTRSRFIVAIVTYKQYQVSGLHAVSLHLHSELASIILYIT